MNQPPLTERVRAYIGRHQLLAGADSVVVGFSGGPDSTALLLLMHELAPAVAAVHLHHGLRPEADADEAWCRDFCGDRGIPYSAARLDVPANRLPGESTEMAARRLRLDWWNAHLSERPGAILALGHHLDDQVETFLLRLDRRANASGLTGLRPRRRLGQLTVIRPLLGVRRAELAEWLAAQGIADTRHDASNDDTSYRRNELRHRLLPVFAEVLDLNAVADSLERLAADAACLEELAASLPDPLPVQALRELPAALRSRALRELLRRHGHGDLPVRGTVVARLNDLLATEELAGPARLPLRPGLELLFERGLVSVIESAPPPLPATRWNWRERPVLELPNGDRLSARLLPRAPADLDDPAATCWPAGALPPELEVRERAPGDRFVPFGSIEEVRVKKVVGGAKVDAWQKQRLLVVAEPGGEILWLCPLRRSACHPLTLDDNPVVQLRYDPGDDEDPDELA